ncbi:hypothetical protein [Actinoplanes sp. L3-i22]|uniref:hypothetical protein n=1 Tax=Actinoplanes sp. L3-i22 TaxID=2836373 RepID=UPI0021035B1B|nr:hypothetical protein [Actinoplanes sp. L3-i22]
MVIATVLLTIIGMIGGYLLSERESRKSRDPQPGATSDQASADASAAPALLPVEGACPDQTQKMAHSASAGGVGELSQVLRITTDRGSVVWICQDEAGNLFYHANRGGTEAKWEEGVTALFIPNVRREPDGSYEGTAPQDGTVFSVTPERLLIRKSSGAETVQSAVGN